MFFVARSSYHRSLNDVELLESRRERLEVGIESGHHVDRYGTGTMHAETRRKPIEFRVSQSLRRIGFEHIEVIHIGHGVIRISAPEANPDDARLVLAAARAVAGVSMVEVIGPCDDSDL